MITIPDELISPCYFFQFQSRYVWQRVGFARKLNTRVSETTITEELLYRFYQFFYDFRLPVRVFESVEEYKNGSDLEVLIKTKHGFILLACQAKITYKSGNYKAFHHYVGGTRQIDLLKDYAARHGGIAQYLLYNFIPDFMHSTDVSLMADLEANGITHIAADDILKWMDTFIRIGKKPPVPHFNTLHPLVAKPFHELICQLLADDEAYLSVFPETAIAKLRYYDEEEVSDADSWRHVTDVGSIGFVSSVTMDDNIDEENTKDGLQADKSKAQTAKPFNPKFRIVIGGEVNNGQIYSIS